MLVWFMATLRNISLLLFDLFLVKVFIIVIPSIESTIIFLLDTCFWFYYHFEIEFLIQIRLTWYFLLCLETFIFSSWKHLQQSWILNLRYFLIIESNLQLHRIVISQKNFRFLLWIWIWTWMFMSIEIKWPRVIIFS